MAREFLTRSCFPPTLRNRQHDRFEHSVRIVQHLVIPKPEQLAAGRTQLPSPKSINIQPGIMLTAIHFNDQ